MKAGGSNTLLQGVDPVGELAVEGEPAAKKLKQELNVDAAKCC